MQSLARHPHSSSSPVAPLPPSPSAPLRLLPLLPNAVLSPDQKERWLTENVATWQELGRAVGLAWAGIPVLRGGVRAAQRPFLPQEVAEQLGVPLCELRPYLPELRAGYDAGARLLEWCYCAGATFPRLLLEEYRESAGFVRRQFIAAGEEGAHAFALGQAHAEARHEWGSCSCPLVPCAWARGPQDPPCVTH